MPVFVSLLRGVNVGGNKKIRMDDLKNLFASLGCTDARTYVQSGNVVFRAAADDAATHRRAIEAAIESAFAFHSDVFLRSTQEMRRVMARNPFAGREGIDPAKLLVVFLDREPTQAQIAAAGEIETAPDEVRPDGAHLYIHFPQGMGRSKLPFDKLYRRLGVTGTGRNWNSVGALTAMAEELERQ